ncbi:hypothetical protein [Mucilaginibacter sp.]|uniref:hypothetical protein n=1 Tax=Mucilaginibacter sp. TaxID=1882438 RepID=UPI002629E2FB|nr:hypothetical protein [Mucilaginibacter sp.]MDB4927509.1 hypothetical protein [Mucilaginibacter sp.]
MKFPNILGTIVAEATLTNKESISKAFNLFADQSRFDYFTFRNDTVNWVAKLVLFTGHDESGVPTRPGYVTETGVTVGGVNVTERSAQTTTLQPQVKCLATRVKCSAQCFRPSDGAQQQINFQDHVAPAGKYFINATFGIANPTLAGNQNDTQAFVELIDNDGAKYTLTVNIK